MPIVITVKVKPRYSVYASPSSTPQAYLYDRIAGRIVERRPHQARYTVHDWVHTADYLNDRVSGYPVPSALLTLRSEHNEDRRKACDDRRRPARGKSRAARK